MNLSAGDFVKRLTVLMPAVGIAALLPCVLDAAPYRAEERVTGELTATGDKALAPLMNAWLTAFRQHQRGISQGTPWTYGPDALAIGTLMFERADMAPVLRDFEAAELAPYDHQFRGDMMKTPLMIRAGKLKDNAIFIAVNRRPGAPLPQKLKEFLSFVLSDEGQRIAGRMAAVEPLDAAAAVQEVAKLQYYLPRLDPALKSYRPFGSVQGEIRSVGSDGMKSLIDRWQQDFSQLYPGVRRGERWEHFGTLNGFHALLTGDADIAPMGRELWSDEQRAYQAVTGQSSPLEIRVARGGFNTPQRTTAQAVFVSAANPIMRISMAQLAAIMGENPAITHWGQLGLTGEWADRPIQFHMPRHVAPNAMSMQMMVLGGRAWRSDAKEGSIADVAAAIAADPAAIGFGGFEEGGPDLKALAVARDEGGPYITANGDSVSTGRYPLTRYMYIRLRRPSGAPLAPQVREFLRYILSREGQESIRYSGYFPLTAAEVEAELTKLNSQP